MWNRCTWRGVGRPFSPKLISFSLQLARPKSHGRRRRIGRNHERPRLEDGGAAGQLEIQVEAVVVQLQSNQFAAVLPKLAPGGSSQASALAEAEANSFPSPNRAFALLSSNISRPPSRLHSTPSSILFRSPPLFDSTTCVALISIHLPPFAIALVPTLRLLQRTLLITNMAPRTRRSEFNSRVTIYEPTAVASASAGNSTTPVKRTRVTRSTASSPAAGSSAAATTKEEDEEHDEKPVKVAKKATTPRKPKPFQEKLDNAHPEPKRWREQYEAIRKQRETVSEAARLTRIA